jgi:alpha-mannosidase
MSRRPLYYTFGVHTHWFGPPWAAGAGALVSSVESLLEWVSTTGLRGNLEIDALGLERLVGERPAVFAALVRAVASGQVELVGGTWGQPCGVLHGGESNVRQRVYGARAQRRLVGVWPRSFWTEELDFFPQLPQLLKSCGFTSAGLAPQWTRNTPELPEETHALVLWEALDGTRLPTVPWNAFALSQWPDELARALKPKALAEGDALAVRQWLEGVVSSETLGSFDAPAAHALLAADKRFELRPCTMSELVTALRELHPDAPARRYSLDDVWHGVSVSKNGDYIPRYSRTAEEQLLAAESVSALACLFGQPYASPEPYPHQELEEAWRDLLTAQHHELHSGEGDNGATGERLFERAIATSGEVFARTLEHLGRRVDALEGSTIIFNPLGWTRDVVHDHGVVRSVPAFGYRVVDPYDEIEEPRLGRIEMREDDAELTLARGNFEVRIERATGLVSQIFSRDWPDGILGAGKPLGGLEMRRNRALERFETVNESSTENSGEFAEFVFLREGRAGSRIRVTYSMSMLHDALWIRLQGENVARPDPGLASALGLAIRPGFKPMKLLHDHPYGTGEVEAERNRSRKYPAGDSWTSAQVFEDVVRPFSASSFVDLLESDAAGRGLLVVHDGCQQFQRDAHGVRALLHSYDLWDEDHYDNVFDAELWLAPHGTLSPTERMRLAMENNLGSPRFESFASALGGGDLPHTLGALEIDASNVLCTAFYRDRSAAAALLENSFAAGALDPHVIRLVEFDGKPAEVTLRLPGPIASAARTDLLGGVLERLTPRAASAPFGPAQLPWSALRFSLRPHEIATIQVDLEFGRHQPLDPAKARLAWAAASRRR